MLIQGDTIVAIRENIDPPSDNTEVIDCKGMIISPGFVDTHHHLWQTHLKGRYAKERYAKGRYAKGRSPLSLVMERYIVY